MGVLLAEIAPPAFWPAPPPAFAFLVPTAAFFDISSSNSRIVARDNREEESPFNETEIQKALLLSNFLGPALEGNIS